MKKVLRILQGPKKQFYFSFQKVNFWVTLSKGNKIDASFTGGKESRPSGSATKFTLRSTFYFHSFMVKKD